ncbi:transcriptional repressor [Georgenia faecalis]|uniref:transcriptional repressor n=1 Tax=Georgenia faecalis TaxID=2483799 RepID=UPI000FDABD29
MSQQRMTRQRAAVTGLLEGTGDFRSAQQIHETLRSRGENVGLATVYRSLQAMADAGDVDVLRGDDGEARYRMCLTRQHHHHLVCRSCGTTAEISGAGVEEWATRMAAEHGFVDVDHTVDLFGTCAGCARGAEGGASRSARAEGAPSDAASAGAAAGTGAAAGARAAAEASAAAGTAAAGERAVVPPRSARA